MDHLKETVREVVFGYAGGSPVVRTYKLADEERGIYAINITDVPHKRPMAVMVQARIDNGRVIIEEDRTDRPLVEALVRAGVPRENIELAYLETLS